MWGQTIKGYKLNWYKNRWWLIAILVVLTILDILTTSWAIEVVQPLVDEQEREYTISFEEQSPLYTGGGTSFVIMRTLMLFGMLFWMFVIYYMYIAKGMDFESYEENASKCPDCYNAPMQQYQGYWFCQRCNVYKPVALESEDLEDVYFEYLNEDGSWLRGIEHFLWGIFIGSGVIVIIINIKAIFQLYSYL